MNQNDLLNQIAKGLVAQMEQEAKAAGSRMSSYDIESYNDAIDDVIENLTRKVEKLHQSHT